MVIREEASLIAGRRIERIKGPVFLQCHNNNFLKQAQN